MKQVVTGDGRTPSDVAIERGGTYEHETHGQVEVLGIWKGVQRVDEAGNSSEAGGPMVVRYSLCEGDHPVGELSDTLEGFLDSIELSD